MPARYCGSRRESSTEVMSARPETVSTGSSSGPATSRIRAACLNKAWTPALSRYSTPVRSTTNEPPAAAAAARPSASRNRSALLMSISPATVTTGIPSVPGRVESSSGVATIDPHVHVDGGAGRSRLDGYVLHERPHQPDAVPAQAAVPGRRGPPAAAVGDGQAQPVRGRDRAQPDLLAGPVAMAVLDRVGDGLPGRDQDILGYPGVHVATAQPVAQRCAHRGELLRLRGEQDVERGGMVVEHQGYVVLVAPGGSEPRHDLAGEFLQ